MVFDPTQPNSSLSQNGRYDSHRNGNGHHPIQMSKADDSDDKDELSLRQILTVLRRRAAILAGTTAISTMGISAAILTRPPEYGGTFRLLVEPVTTGSRLAESLTSDTLQTLKPLAQRFDKGDGLDYISQMEVLKSETLLDPVITKIQERYPEIDYETLMKRLKVSRPKDSKILDFTYQSRDQEEIKFVLSKLSEAYLKYSVNDRQNNLNRGIEFVDQQIQRQRQEVTTLEVMMENFRRQNNLIDPQESAKVLSEKVKEIATDRESNQVKLAASVTLLENLQQQIGTQPAQALNSATLSESPTYQNLLGKLREVDSKIAVESARFREGTPQIESLRDQRENLLPLLREEAEKIMGVGLTIEGSNGVKYQGTVARDLTKQFIETANDVEVLATQEQALAQAAEEIKQETQQLAGVARQYGQIQRNLQIAAASLTRLITARENLQLESARQANPWEMISKLDERNIKTKVSPLLLLLLGALASVIIGVAAALLAEQFDRVFHTVEELKDTNLPCLGMIPYNLELNRDSSLMNVGRLEDDLPSDLSAKAQKSKRYHTTFLEAFYSLDANIRLLSSDSPIRSLTISSTSPADGKSTISSHLAWAAVTMGRKVLIVDTDLRRPQVHRWFGIPNLRGLSTAITSDVDVMDLIQESPQDKNLFILPAGPTPPAPGRLLGSNRMRQFAEQFKQHFDLVIFDAPPLIAFADAKLVSAHTDGLLLVVGLGKTDRGSLIRVLDDLNNTATAPTLGIVANGLKSYTINYYYQYQRYYTPDDSDTKTPVSLGRRS
ncbi:MAG: polysaccharide biosynthesis tyrosine autokinase [Leptolyngbya sp. Prado105]|jgi:capsular exopolysaccharide synthesis family protein|nr:polysaccharide biosynthesis tyrosine autokinase [Leptolyngbya sp. Prado105]